MSNSASETRLIAAWPSSASLNSNGKRVAERIFRTMLRIVDESSTINTRLGRRMGIERSKRFLASSRLTGFMATASVVSGALAVPVAVSITVNGGLVAARAAETTWEQSALGRLASRY